MAFYTPEPLVSAKRFEQEILHLHAQMKMASSLTLPAAVREARYPRIGYPVVSLEWSLLLIDEADRLKPMALEVLRDLFDRSQMGVVLIV
jgi:DNA transposition AAA+ family ATPase